MDKKLFERLTESMTQLNEIIEGSREPSRETTVTAVQVKAIRTASGPAKALLCAIERDPQHVIPALSPQS